MPNNKNYWVHSRKGGGYSVKREGGERASAITDTQAEAWAITRNLAKKSKGEAFLTRKVNHTIRERNTYGHDPRSSKG